MSETGTYRRRGTVTATLWMEPGDHPAVYDVDPSGYAIVTTQGPMMIDPGMWIVDLGDGAYELMADVLFVDMYEAIA